MVLPFDGFGDERVEASDARGSEETDANSLGGELAVLRERLIGKGV